MLINKAKPNTCSQYIEASPEEEVYENIAGYILEKEHTVNDSLDERASS